MAIAPPETGSNPSQLLYISLSFGFSLAVNAWGFSAFSAGLFNPCVTLSLYLTGNLSGIRALVTFAVQMIGGIQAFLTFGLMFTIYMLAAEKHKDSTYHLHSSRLMLNSQASANTRRRPS